MSTNRPKINNTGDVLAGLRVCMLVTNSLEMDSRVIREATTSAAAGADTTVICVRQDVSPGLASLPFDIVAVTPLSSSTSRLWLLRVVANLGREYMFFRRLGSVARRVNADVYWANDLDTLWPALRAATKRRSGIVYDAHELFTDQVAIPGWRRRVFDAIEKRFINRADVVVTVNDDLAGYLAKKFDLPLPEVVFNGPEDCRPNSAHPSVPLRVICQGSMSRERGFEALVDAMGNLRGVATLALQGYGELEPALRERVETLGLGDVVSFVPPCAATEVVAHASGYDIGLVATDPTCLNTRLSSPVKLFTYMGAGLAMAAASTPVVAQIVREFDCGILFDGMRPDLISDALRWLADHPDEVVRFKRNSAAACERYAWARQAPLVVEAIRTAATAHGRGRFAEAPAAI